MNVGTKSVLFGVHQIFWHPITVLRAWVELYHSFPNWKELVCIFIHDWGYWGKPNMDGDEGERHVKWAADVAGRWFGEEYRKLCLYHSRHYARRDGAEPSKLCWPDKLSHLYEPSWWYLFRARLSGELQEYRNVAATSGMVMLSQTDEEWFAFIKSRLVKLGREQNPNVVPYANEERVHS